jgi:hypothetical protein
MNYDGSHNLPFFCSARTLKGYTATLEISMANCALFSKTLISSFIANLRATSRGCLVYEKGYIITFGQG